MGIDEDIAQTITLIGDPRVLQFIDDFNVYVNLTDLPKLTRKNPYAGEFLKWDGRCFIGHYINRDYEINVILNEERTSLDLVLDEEGIERFFPDVDLGSMISGFRIKKNEKEIILSREEGILAAKIDCRGLYPWI